MSVSYFSPVRVSDSCRSVMRPRVRVYILLILSISPVVFAPSPRSDVAIALSLPSDRSGLRIACRWAQPSETDKVLVRVYGNNSVHPASADDIVELDDPSGPTFRVGSRATCDIECIGAKSDPLRYSIVGAPRLQVVSRITRWYFTCERRAGDKNLKIIEHSKRTVRWWDGNEFVGRAILSDTSVRSIRAHDIRSDVDIDPATGHLTLSHPPQNRCISCQVLDLYSATHIRTRCWSADTAVTPIVTTNISNFTGCVCVDSAIRTAIVVAVSGAALITVLLAVVIGQPGRLERLGEEAIVRSDSREMVGRQRTIEPDVSSNLECSLSSQPPSEMRTEDALQRPWEISIAETRCTLISTSPPSCAAHYRHLASRSPEAGLSWKPWEMGVSYVRPRLPYSIPRISS